MNRKNLKYYLLLVFGILVLVNILSDRFFMRLDFTEDERYTLSQTTIDILNEMEEPVTIKAYFSEGLQPQFDQVRRDFKDLLSEYATRSHNLLVYEFINPNEDEDSERKASEAGIQPLVVSSREKDQTVQKRAYMGVVIQIGEESEVIPFVNPQAQMEYTLTTALKKLVVQDKPAIGFISGHGEASLSSMQQVAEGLSVLFQPELVEMTDSVVLSKYKSIVIVNPTDSIPETHLQLLSSYLQQGGNIFVAINAVRADFQQSMGFAQSTGLESWLKKYGISVDQNFVLDANCGSVSVQQQQGPFRFNTQVQFPYLPIISEFAEHSIVDGMSGLLLQFASTLNYSGDSLITYTPLAFTSGKSATERAPIYFNVQKQWTDNDFPLQKLSVAGLFEGSFNGGVPAKMVVVTDGDFPINGEDQQARAIQPDNVNMVVNAVDFMSDDSGLIQLRAKQIKLRPIDQLEDSTKTLLKIVNFSVPLLLILLIGIFRWQKRRIVRLKRMEGDYV
ncbi:MAG: Gldg family protein [Marinilabiliaceae bacterium]|nr:Gldg family protein [Marinilabiliaceae bacterium]